VIKVLVIDDEPTITKLLAGMLAGPEFEVHTFNSGHQGIEAARQLEPDIILLDLMMPGINGWEVCQKIRTFSQVPILILSAVTGSDKVMRALDEGANAYLVKPIPKSVLISNIKMLLEQASS